MTGKCRRCGCEIGAGELFCLTCDIIVRENNEEVRRVTEIYEKEFKEQAAEINCLRDDMEKADLTIIGQSQRIRELEDALQGLYDEQNGPPLIRDAESWQRAMDKAEEQIKSKEAK